MPLDDQIRQIADAHRQRYQEFERSEREIIARHQRLQREAIDRSRRELAEQNQYQPDQSTVDSNLYLVQGGKRDGWSHAYDEKVQLAQRWDLEKGYVPREFAKGQDGQYYERIERHTPSMSMVPPGHQNRYAYHEYQTVKDSSKIHDARMNERTPEADRNEMRWYINAEQGNGNRHGEKMWSMEFEKDKERTQQNREAFVSNLRETGRNPMAELKKQLEAQDIQSRRDINSRNNKTHKSVSEVARNGQERDRGHDQQQSQMR